MLGSKCFLDVGYAHRASKLILGISVRRHPVESTAEE